MNSLYFTSWSLNTSTLDIAIKSSGGLVLSGWLLKELYISSRYLCYILAYIAYMVAIILILAWINLHWFLHCILTISFYSKLDHSIVHLQYLCWYDLLCNLSIWINRILRRFCYENYTVRSYYTWSKWDIQISYLHLWIDFLLIVRNLSIILHITVLWEWIHLL